MAQLSLRQTHSALSPTKKEGQDVHLWVDAVEKGKTASSNGWCDRQPLKTLADQAVTALENAPPFEEVPARTRELVEVPEQQMDLSIRDELQPVFEAMLSDAIRTAKANFRTMHWYRAAALRAVAMHDAGADIG